jgi:hypothetical protein
MSKFLKDGRKVAVISDMDGGQFLVQEVFVEKATGIEAAGGKKFIASELFDVPVETWHDKQIRVAEERYEARKERIERDDKALSDRLKNESELVKAKIAAMKEFSSNAAKEQLETLEAFLAGEIKFLAYPDKWKPEIITFDNKIVQKCDGKFEALRLVSLFGRSNGDLSFGINHYRDGSGGWETAVPFKDYESALQYMQKKCDEEAAEWVSGKRNGFGGAHWSEIAGIVIPADATAKIKLNADSARLEKIDVLKKQLQELEGAV